MPREIKKKEVQDKKVFDLDKFLEEENISESVGDRPIEFYELDEAFKEATGLPGFPKGYVSAVRGFSDTGKSTAVFEAAVAAQKAGDLPVIIDVENNLDYKHLMNMGFEAKEIFNEETGEFMGYKGNYIHVDCSYLKRYSKKYGVNQVTIEGTADFIHDMLDKQEQGKLPKNLCFIYDSIGVLNGNQSARGDENQGGSNNQWNAHSYEAAFRSIWNQKIPLSRKLNSKYINTFIAVNRIWLEASAAMPVVKNKGGNALYSATRLLIHVGGSLNASTKKLNATSGGKVVNFGMRTKIKVEKNHLGDPYGGISMEGTIISTPHGYIKDTKEAIDQYKKDNFKYFAKLLAEKMGNETNEDDIQDFDIEELTGNFSEE